MKLGWLYGGSPQCAGLIHSAYLWRAFMSAATGFGGGPVACPQFSLSLALERFLCLWLWGGGGITLFPGAMVSHQGWTPLSCPLLVGSPWEYLGPHWELKCLGLMETGSKWAHGYCAYDALQFQLAVGEPACHTSNDIAILGGNRMVG